MVKYFISVIWLYISHYIFSPSIKLYIGKYVLASIGKLFGNKKYIELSEHINYKMGNVSMKCDKFEFDSIPSYDLKNVSVSIVIPTRDHLKDLNKCIGSIISISTYCNYDILIVDNQSDEYTKDWLYNCPYEKVSVVEYDDEYNYAAIHNTVIPDCDSEYIIMLNNDTEVIEPTWIEQLIGPMINDSSIGITGAKLLFPDHTIQHCGVLYSETIGGFFHVNSHKCDKYPRTNELMIYPAVTGACIAFNRELYMDLNGMDENLPIAYNDIDLCMKMNNAGYKVLYTPYARLYHYESQTRGYDTTIEKQMIELKERNYFKNKWGNYIHDTFI